MYFKADNNKVYAISGDELSYEYHFTELLKLNKKYENNSILVNGDKTIFTSVNFELVFTIYLAYTNVIQNAKMHYMAPKAKHQVYLKEIK